MPSKIEWTEETWNPVTGCSKISPGCKNCYAERMSKRLKGRFGYPEDDPFKVTFHKDKFYLPFTWRAKPRKVFVCSMGDLLHKDVPEIVLERLLLIMLDASQHTFILLTKRPERMKNFFSKRKRSFHQSLRKHIWLGVSIENQEQADKRIPILLSIPATVRFVSVEPMLEGIDLNGYLPLFDIMDSREQINDGKCLDWVIVGAESGPKPRKIDNHWILNLLLQCSNADVPVFLKQAWMDGKLVKMPKIGGRVWDKFPKRTNEK